MATRVRSAIATAVPARVTIWRRRLAALVVLAVGGRRVALVVSRRARASGQADRPPAAPHRTRRKERSEPGGYRSSTTEVHSEAVPGRELGFNVIVPSELPQRGHRALIVYLHGRGGYGGPSTKPCCAAMHRLHGHGPFVVFPPAVSTATGTTEPTASGKTG